MAPAPDTTASLTDPFGRRITYLRMSITDRCDFRCQYCMAENPRFVPRPELLSLEELLEVGRSFVALGVTKIRVTGGEPLVRKNALWLLRELAQLSGLRELALTTNGSQLERMADELRAAGVRRLNVSLDSLRPQRFREITRVGNLQAVLRGLECARRAGFHRIKINSVILRGRNHDEVVDLVHYATENGFDISFIEEMPLGPITSHDRAAVFYPSDRILADLQSRHSLLPTTETTGGPSRYYRLAGSDSRIGFISPHSQNFCDRCNRVRLTAQGRLLLCLGQEHSTDLRAVLRNPSSAPGALEQSIRNAVALKPHGHEFRLDLPPVILRHMHVTGG